jgi:hypothetical protein
MLVAGWKLTVHGSKTHDITLPELRLHGFRSKEDTFQLQLLVAEIHRSNSDEYN